MSEKLVLAQALEEMERRNKRRKLFTLYPERGPLSRHNYPKHMSFFKATAEHRFCVVMGGNRVGKTSGCTGPALAYALTGLYPHWYQGRRWDRPVHAWVAGKSSYTTRDILQKMLLGQKADVGTGLIPGDLVLATPPKGGISEAVDVAYIKHVSGGTSSVQFKAYEQGRQAFEGDKKDIILLDEEPPQTVLGECLLRLMDEKSPGSLWAGFTPLDGITPLLASMFPDGLVKPGVLPNGMHLTIITWDDAPHLSKEDRAQVYATMMPYEREARTKGLPSFGSGLVYPVPQDDFVIDSFVPPDDWKRGYGMDFGWNNTAAVFGAQDPNSGQVVLYGEYLQGGLQIPVHASGIKEFGEWLPGLADPAGHGRTQTDGAQVIDLYRREGLDLYTANNGVNAGTREVYNGLSRGNLKVMRHLKGFLREIGLYRRNEKGEIVKSNDHLLDAARYLYHGGVPYMRVGGKKGAQAAKPVATSILLSHPQAWMI